MRKQRALPLPRCCRYDLHADVKPPTVPAENGRSTRMYCIRTCAICRRLCLYHTDCSEPFFVVSFNPVLRPEVHALGVLVQALVKIKGDKVVAKALADVFPPVIERLDSTYRELRCKLNDRLGMAGVVGDVYHTPEALAAMGRRSTPANS